MERGPIRLAQGRSLGIRVHLHDLPKIGGSVAIVTCGEGEAIRYAQPVAEAAGAEDFFLKTYAGGSHFLFSRDVGALQGELAVAESAGDRKFAAIVDLQHLGCITYGFRGASVPVSAQLAAIMDSQDTVAGFLGASGVVIPVYQLVVHPTTGFFYTD